MSEKKTWPYASAKSVLLASTNSTNYSGSPSAVGNGNGFPERYHAIPSPLTSEFSPANFTTNNIKRMNLRGTVIIAFISINLGPTASDREIKIQQKRFAKKSGAANALGSPS